jgi:hypothetical protein
MCAANAAALAGSLSSMNTPTIVLPERSEVIWISDGAFFNSRAISLMISILNPASFAALLITVS